jgi:polysaccharide export outer membrane protein
MNARIRKRGAMRMITRWQAALFLTAAVALPLAGQDAAETPPPASNTKNHAGASIIGPGDAVTISALNVEEISKSWRVSSSGELSLPMVGVIRARGMTVRQLEQAIATRLRKYVHDPQVSAFVSEFRSHPVTVSGGVEKPGVLQLQGPTPLFAVLAQTGAKDVGPTITLTRSVDYGLVAFPGAKLSPDRKHYVIEFASADVMRGYGEAANFPVIPYDVISVAPDKHRRLVYISGEVNKAGAVELVNQDSVSLTKVIAMAGGLTSSADLGKTVIRHINTQGVETAFTFVDLKKVLSGKAKDLELTEGDIVVVPTSELKSYLQTASRSAITTGLWILGTL